MQAEPPPKHMAEEVAAEPAGETRTEDGNAGDERQNNEKQSRRTAPRGKREKQEKERRGGEGREKRKREKKEKKKKKKKKRKKKKRKPIADIHWGRSKPQAQSAGVPPDERARHDRVLLLAIVNACKMIGE